MPIVPSLNFDICSQKQIALSIKDRSMTYAGTDVAVSLQSLVAK